MNGYDSTAMADPDQGITARIRHDPTSWVLIAVNIAAAIYVAFHPPITSGLLTLYWCECVIIGGFNILKFFLIPIKLGPAAEENPFAGLVLRTIGRLFLSGAFIVHYGIVMLCCAALIGGLEGEERKMLSSPGAKDTWHDLLLPIILLTAGHAISFVWHYLIRKEYEERTISDQMARPYPRVLAMFFSLMVGGILVSVFRLPALLMLVFMPIKIIADLNAHFRDHMSQKATFMHLCRK